MTWVSDGTRKQAASQHMMQLHGCCMSFQNWWQFCRVNGVSIAAAMFLPSVNGWRQTEDSSRTLRVDWSARERNDACPQQNSWLALATWAKVDRIWCPQNFHKQTVHTGRRWRPVACSHTSLCGGCGVHCSSSEGSENKPGGSCVVYWFLLCFLDSSYVQSSICACPSPTLCQTCVGAGCSSVFQRI